MTYDFLIVGSGPTGATMARLLFEKGYKVLVVEKRGYIGGNIADSINNKLGILRCLHGVHYFRTNSEPIWDFVNRFAKFVKFEAEIKSLVGGKFENWPISQEYILRTVGENWKPSFSGIPTNFEEASLAMMPEQIYYQFVKRYTEKQWGVDCKNLSTSLARRFNVHLDNDPRLKKDKYQGLPIGGYSSLITNMLYGIIVETNFDYLTNRDKFRAKHTIFTGPIDAFFDYSLGKLRYRGQSRKDHIVSEQTQPVCQINYPGQNCKEIRSIEWNHLPYCPPQKKSGSIITYETTKDAETYDEMEYPFPDEQNEKLALEYKKLAINLDKITICGRLGKNLYMDTDSAIASAMNEVKKLVG